MKKDNTWNEILGEDIENFLLLGGPQTRYAIRREIGEDPFETEDAIDYLIAQGRAKMRKNKLELISK